MFSLDDDNDDLDITEQDFLKAALDLESQASSGNHPETKRRSFELSTGNNHDGCSTSIQQQPAATTVPFPLLPAAMSKPSLHGGALTAGIQDRILPGKTSGFETTCSTLSKEVSDSEIAQTLDAFACDFEDSPEIPLATKSDWSEAKSVLRTGPAKTTGDVASEPRNNGSLSKKQLARDTSTADKTTEDAIDLNEYKKVFEFELDTDLEFSFSDDPFAGLEPKGLSTTVAILKEVPKGCHMSSTVPSERAGTGVTSRAVSSMPPHGHPEALSMTPSANRPVLTAPSSVRTDHATPVSSRTSVGSGKPVTPSTAAPSGMRTDHSTPVSSRTSVGSGNPVTPSPAAPSGMRTDQATPVSSRTSVPGSGKRKRKFPGPAGVLPKLKPGSPLAELHLVQPVSPATPSNIPKAVSKSCVDLASSQTSDEQLFSDLPWTRMMMELEPQAQAVLHNFNVAAVLCKASHKQLPKGKVPAICVLIESMDLHSADASVLLKDPSGSMKGTIHRQLLKEYPTQLQPGAVLVLRQVGVFSPSTRSHYLNITPNNLIRIYGKDSDGQLDKQKVADFIPDDFVIQEPPPPPPVPQLDARSPVGGGSVQSPGGGAAWGQFQTPRSRFSGPNQSSAGPLWKNNGVPSGPSVCNQASNQNSPRIPPANQNLVRCTPANQNSPRYPPANQIALNHPRANQNFPQPPAANQNSPRFAQPVNQNCPRYPAANQSSPRLPAANQNSPRSRFARPVNQNCPRFPAANQSSPRLPATNQNLPQFRPTDQNCAISSNKPSPGTFRPSAPTSGDRSHTAAPPGGPGLNHSAVQALRSQDSNAIAGSNPKPNTFNFRKQPSSPLVAETVTAVQCSSAQLWQDDGLDAMLNGLDKELLTDF